MKLAEIFGLDFLATLWSAMDSQELTDAQKRAAVVAALGTQLGAVRRAGMTVEELADQVIRSAKCGSSQDRSGQPSRRGA